jgi:hypothetical protein
MLDKQAPLALDGGPFSTSAICPLRVCEKIRSWFDWLTTNGIV